MRVFSEVHNPVRHCEDQRNEATHHHGLPRPLQGLAITRRFSSAIILSLLGLGSLLCLSACGFEPAGNHPIVPITLHMGAEDLCMRQALDRKMVLPDDPKKAPTLTIMSVQFAQSPLSYNSYNQVYQQRIRLNVLYKITDHKGNTIVPETTAWADREQRMSNRMPLSALQEQKMLHNALCREITDRIFWQLEHSHYASHAG